MSTKNFILARIMIVCLIASFSSCRENKWHRYLEGGWTIDSINYKGHNIKKCLMINGMGFNENNSLFLPSAPHYRCSKFNEPVEVGTYKIQEISNDSAIVEITTMNHIFSGRHLVIKQDPVKHNIVLKSDSLYILMGQGGYQ